MSFASTNLIKRTIGDRHYYLEKIDAICLVYTPRLVHTQRSIMFGETQR